MSRLIQPAYDLVSDVIRPILHNNLLTLFLRIRVPEASMSTYVPSSLPADANTAG